MNSCALWVCALSHRNWTFHDSHKDMEYKVLKKDIAGKERALLDEALFAAREIMRTPSSARGGPWSSPKPLTCNQIDLIQKVARCTTHAEVLELASTDARSALARHLCQRVCTDPHCDVCFLSDMISCGMLVWLLLLISLCACDLSFSTEAAAQSQEAIRVRCNRSGTPGNVRRKRSLMTGEYLQNDAQHQRAHRGRDVSERRRFETTKRLSRAKT